MKKFLFLALFLVISCETTPTVQDSASTIKFFKCLLLDSDVTFKYLEELVEAVKTMDPVKLVNVFTTIYPAIAAEVARCKKESINEIVEKPVEEVVEKKEVKEEKAPKNDLLKTLWKLFVQYVLPFLKTLGINLVDICKMILPDSFYCDLLGFL